MEKLNPLEGVELWKDFPFEAFEIDEEKKEIRLAEGWKFIGDLEDTNPPPT